MQPLLRHGSLCALVQLSAELENSRHTVLQPTILALLQRGEAATAGCCSTLIVCVSTCVCQVSVALTDTQVAAAVLKRPIWMHCHALHAQRTDCMCMQRCVPAVRLREPQYVAIHQRCSICRPIVQTQKPAACAVHQRGRPWLCCSSSCRGSLDVCLRAQLDMRHMLRGFDRTALAAAAAAATAETRIQLQWVQPALRACAALHA
jgi:hypothetical protein